MDLKLDLSGVGILPESIKPQRQRTEAVMERLWRTDTPWAGWVRLPMEQDKLLVERILLTAAEIQQKCDLFIVVGIGGSYLGARAAIAALGTLPDCPQILFAGINMSGGYYAELLRQIRDQEVCLCIISKSGGTMEVALGEAILKEALIEKYGEDAAIKRIYVITDPKQGRLREEAERVGYTSFPVPQNIGGRYSVLTAVGLLPMAVAGIDIKALLGGADGMASDPAWDFDAADYGLIRYLLMESGKTMEVFASFEPKLQCFMEWLKQLFAESEGKAGKGIFPVAMQYTTDLHSMGQFLQQGRQMFFETVLTIREPSEDVLVPASAEGFLAGKSLNELNRMASEAVLLAHRETGIPVVSIEIPRLSEFYLGQLFYFFQMTCAVSASLMEVNPFDQPGVENYKREIGRLLEKQGL